jgi:hypothetical protein
MYINDCVRLILFKGSIFSEIEQTNDNIKTENADFENNFTE